ncbi:MAG: amino acid synthesis family protein [Achromobacter sp.]|uniref:amino acid synthesis family protein n=1 Tax=Achromobacter sp. TaxID=134375 RepID=UPI0012CB526A|nr:amino acid synthesis family protein [Achromobacter sp.]MPS79710.1 amino acid synthesis family protein [Achromobacter sp.]
MRQTNFGNFHIRKWFLQIESTRASEHGAMEPDTDPQRKVVLAALLENPFLREGGYDSRSDQLTMAAFAKEFVIRLTAALKGRSIRGQGRAFIVGADGEHEQGVDLMGENFAASVLTGLGTVCPFLPLHGRRGNLRDRIDIGLVASTSNVRDLAHDSVSACFNDAPGPDEILLVWAISTRDRIIGERHISHLDGL